MTSAPSLLTSWRAGPAKDALLEFLAAAESLPVEARVAAFDVDGTLWCERPTYVQYDFFADALATASAANPALRDQPEYAAVLNNDAAAIADLGLPRVAFALADLFRGWGVDEFTVRSREFLAAGQHRMWHRPLRELVYQPMMEVLEALRQRHFSIFLVTGGGTEFVRAIAGDLFGVAPEAVVGTQIAYDFVRDEAGRPSLRRTARLEGGANEGAEKVLKIQTQLGRRPVFAAGNSGGDREMLEWACNDSGPHLALLVDHDDAEREFAYASTAATFEEDEPITAVAERLGWTVASMARDWETVFPS